MTEFLPIFGHMPPSTAILTPRSESNMTDFFICVFCIPTLFKREILILWNQYLKDVVLCMAFRVLYRFEQFSELNWLLNYCNMFIHMLYFRHMFTLLTNIMWLKGEVIFFTNDIIRISYMYCYTWHFCFNHRSFNGRQWDLSKQSIG